MRKIIILSILIICCFDVSLSISEVIYEEQAPINNSTYQIGGGVESSGLLTDDLEKANAQLDGGVSSFGEKRYLNTETSKILNPKSENSKINITAYQMGEAASPLLIAILLAVITKTPLIGAIFSGVTSAASIYLEAIDNGASENEALWASNLSGLFVLLIILIPIFIVRYFISRHRKFAAINSCLTQCESFNHGIENNKKPNKIWKNMLGVIIVIFFAFILGLLKDPNVHLGFIPTAIIFYLFLFTLDKFAGWNLGFRKKDKNSIVDSKINNIKTDKKDLEECIANFVKMKLRELKIQERFKSIFFWSFAPIAFFIFDGDSWYLDLNSYADDDEKAFLSILIISIIFSFFVGGYVDKFFSKKIAMPQLLPLFYAVFLVCITTISYVLWDSSSFYLTAKIIFILFFAMFLLFFTKEHKTITNNRKK